jgi:hypothetical protein
MVHFPTKSAPLLRLPRTFQVLAMTKSEGLTVMIRAVKRLQLLLFLLQPLFLDKCLCAFTYFVSFTD